jgi:hypothetical protein
MLIDPFSPVGDIDPSSHPGFLLWQGANEWERTVNIQLEKY